MYKMNDQVQTPNGPGKVISLPIGKSEYYTVLHYTGRAGLYPVNQLKPSGEIPQIENEAIQ
jgi:hypothetical protein